MTSTTKITLSPGRTVASRLPVVAEGVLGRDADEHPVAGVGAVRPSVKPFTTELT